MVGPCLASTTIITLGRHRGRTCPRHILVQNQAISENKSQILSLAKARDTTAKKTSPPRKRVSPSTVTTPKHVKLQALQSPTPSPQTTTTTADAASDAFRAFAAVEYPAELSSSLRGFHGSLFVRESYVEFYNRIVHLMETRDFYGATVVENPGVGKSVFMAYFFARYTREHKETSVVIIRYDSHSKAKKAIVWKRGVVKEVEGSDVKRIQCSFARDEDVVFLLDGTPKGVPVEDHRFVAFMRPDEKWLDNMTGETGHSWLSMPLWTLEELQAAVEALKLADTMGRIQDIPGFCRSQDSSYTQEVAYRFAVFGGLARPCLETIATQLASELQKLQAHAASVDVVTGKLAYPDRNNPNCSSGDASMTSQGDNQGVSYRLYHCYASTLPSGWRLKVASPYVTSLLATRVNSLSHKKKMHFEGMANWNVEASTLRREMLKNRLLITLQRGVHVVANSLAHNANCPEYDMQLTIPSSGPSSEKRKTSGAYESIDAFFVAKSLVRDGSKDSDCGIVEIADQDTAPWRSIIQAVVFHVAEVGNHGVDARGLYALLQHLQSRWGVDPVRVALVYVVPEGRANRSTRQEIEGYFGSDEILPLMAVKGVTAEMSEALRMANVHNIRDLDRCKIDACEDAVCRRVLEQAQAALREHRNNAVVSESATHAMLEQVQQFVWNLAE